jgi:cation:H+ antiporter
MMGVAGAVPLFLGSLAVTLTAAATFARRLDRLGERFGMPEVWIGLLTALAADGPEVFSALVALIKGAHGASLGVIVGSNTFNLAAMLGVSALLAGSVRVPRRTLLLEGTVGVVVTGVVIALLAGWVGAGIAVAVAGCAIVPYLVVVVGGHELVRALGFERLADAVLERDAQARDAQRHDGAGGAGHEFRTPHQVALMVMDLGLIVGGSFGMVEAALTLGSRWGIASAVVGALILGPLTSLPNAFTGVRLGTSGRGAALVTEALNSNTINLVAGVALPSLVVTLAARTSADRIDLALLAASTLAAVALLARGTGLRRLGGIALVALYVGFVVVAVS